MSDEQQVVSERTGSESDVAERGGTRFRALFTGELFRTRGYRAIARRAREKMKRLEELQSLPPEAKARIRPKLRHDAVMLAAIERRESITGDIFVDSFDTLTVLAAIVFPFLVAVWLGFPNPYSTSGESMALYFLIYFVGVIIVMRFSSFVQRQTSRRVIAAWWLISLLVSALILSRVDAGAGARTFGLSSAVLIAIVSYYALLSALFLIALLLSYSIGFFYGKYIINRYPDAVLADSLLTILWNVEKYPNRWTDLGFKRDIMRDLEVVASSFQHSLPRKLRSGDVETDAWLQLSLLKVAVAFRGQKKWILNPKQDTRSEFLKYVSDSFTDAVSGNWDSLAREDPPGLRDQSRLWLGRVGEFLKTLVIAFLPLIGLGILQSSPLQLQEEMAGFVAVGALIWASLTIIATLDPLYGSKISAMKDITQLFPFGGKGKGAP